MQAPFFFLRIGGLIVLTMLAGCDTPTMVEPAASNESDRAVVVGTVRLLVDFTGQRANVRVKVPCSTNSTVFQILERAQNMSDLEFDSQGGGGTVFVHSINEVMNQRGRGKNWVFRVNGELAHESCGTFKVSPGDEIEWVFGDYQPEAE